MPKVRSLNIVIAVIMTMTGLTGCRADTGNVTAAANSSSVSITTNIFQTSNPSEYRPLFFDIAFLKTVKERVQSSDTLIKPAFDKLIRDADAALKDGPYSVTFKTSVPPGGDKHDYLSISPYHWPDPEAPGSKPYIYRDGEVNPDYYSDKYDKRSMDKMVSAVNTLTFAYFYTDKIEYGNRAAELLKVWFLNRDTYMTPALKYAQGIPGASDGRPVGIIETQSLVTIPDSAILLSGLAGWTTDDEKALKEWFHEYLVWLRTSANGLEEEKAANNHGTWYRAQVVTFALFTGETTLAEGILQQDVPELIAGQIEPDGRQPLELARTRSLHYSVYNLEALISLAVLGERFGSDVWDFSTTDGRSIKRALDFVVPYFNGGKWPYKEIITENEFSFAYYLKRASVRYNEPGYSAAAEAALGAGAASDRSNLLCPNLAFS